MTYAMRMLKVAVLLTFPALLAACGGDEHEGYVREARAAPARATQPAARPAPPPRPMTAADSAAVRSRIAAESASVAAAFLKVPRLKAREIGNLRLDKNATQVASAQSLGVRVSGQAEIDRMVRQGRLVPLGDSTQYWILRGMDHSSPYVTPDTKAMLEDLGRRFHRRLDSLGLPRYRMKVTSAIRTEEAQVDLRKTNSYAASTTSAHQFGTTVDVSHERFAVPAGPRAAVGAASVPIAGAWELEGEMLEEVGKENARALQAELGRALTELRTAGAVHVMMENKQPVYHFTLARRFTGPPASR
ncbi:MAG TPA: DUF5715 family protein [Longimicrobium sp.]|nr:DUF5715 family protein [Longimicrobium sp.]